MTAKSISFGAPFSWLAASFDALRKDNGMVLGATALLMLVAFVPGLLNLGVDAIMQPMATGTALAIQVFFMLVGTVLFPPIFGGYFRILHARELGQPVRATDIFALFREPAAAWRMIATALLFMAIYMVALIAMNFATGGYVMEFIKVAMTTQPGQQPVFPPVPSGIVLWFLVMVFLGITLMTAYMLAITQTALSTRTPVEAIGDGFGVTLRNLAVFVVFYLAVGIAGCVFLLIFGLVVALVAMLFGLINPILAIVVIAPIYLALMLLLYAVMFGFNYYAWRDTLGDAGAQVHQQLAA
jgi:hypothetical protein